jgi:hypothetical protein
LGLGLFALEKNLEAPMSTKHSSIEFDPNRLDDEQIAVQYYPQLKALAWQLREDALISPRDALNIYERNWRLIDLEKMTTEEKKLIEQLKNEVGKGCLLV